MEKISKEELMKKLNLSDEGLEKVTGGSPDGDHCRDHCWQSALYKDITCSQLDKEGAPREVIESCERSISTRYYACMADCPE